MQIVTQSNKDGCLLDKTAVDRLSEISSKLNKEIIPFPETFFKICSSFQISKPLAWQLLRELRDKGYLEIIASRGVRIKNG